MGYPRPKFRLLIMIITTGYDSKLYTLLTVLLFLYCAVAIFLLFK